MSVLVHDTCLPVSLSRARARALSLSVSLSACVHVCVCVCLNANTQRARAGARHHSGKQGQDKTLDKGLPWAHGHAKRP